MHINSKKAVKIVFFVVYSKSIIFSYEFLQHRIIMKAKIKSKNSPISGEKFDNPTACNIISILGILKFCIKSFSIFTDLKFNKRRIKFNAYLDVGALKKTHVIFKNMKVIIQFKTAGTFLKKFFNILVIIEKTP